MRHDDDALAAKFAASPEAPAGDRFVASTCERIAELRRRRRMLAAATRAAGFAVVVLAAPWLIEGSRRLSDVLAAASVRAADLLLGPAGMGAALLVCGLFGTVRWLGRGR